MSALTEITPEMLGGRSGRGGATIRQPAASNAGNADATAVMHLDDIGLPPPERVGLSPGQTIRHRPSDNHATAKQSPSRAAPAGASAGPSERPMEAVRQPPEIKLTEHHLPPDEPLDLRLVMLEEPDANRAASFRILRHHLMDHGRPQVIVVSSPSPGDGKTTCAVNLALALAECGRARVLLVEACLRQPQLSEIFRFTPPWCFAEQLAAHRQQPLMPWSAVHLPEMWLHVAAMDPSLDNRQLLDAPAFTIAMERLRMGKYDHIVVDAPAVLGSAEVNLIQDAADGVIMVARAKKTTVRTMRKAVEQLTPTKIIGSVLLQ